MCMITFRIFQRTEVILSKKSYQEVMFLIHLQHMAHLSSIRQGHLSQVSKIRCFRQCILGGDPETSSMNLISFYNVL